MYGTSSLFLLSAPQSKAQMGITMGWKQEPWSVGVVFAFSGLLGKHIRTPLKQALLEGNREKMCEVFPSHSGCCSEDMRKHCSFCCSGWLHRVKTALSHCVTPVFRPAAAHRALWLPYYSLYACICVTYLFTAMDVRNERKTSFWRTSKLAWPLTTRTVGKYISIRAPTL